MPMPVDIHAMDAVRRADGPPPQWRRWWCPLRALVFGQVVATLLTAGPELFRRIGARWTGDYWWYQDHLDAYRVLENLSLLAFLTSLVFPLAIWWMARRRGVAGREFAWLLIATLALGLVPFVAILPAVQ